MFVANVGREEGLLCDLYTQPHSGPPSKAEPKNLFLFINFWLCWVFVAAWAFLQLQRVGDYSLAAVCGLLILVAFLSKGLELQQFWHMGSVVVSAPRL